jgi:putative (di)nucleoside polyphosphate hydrolase
VIVAVVRRSTVDGAPDEVMAFERIDVPGAWQLPQGGIDEGESPLDAAWRELAEETGLRADHVLLAGEFDEWTVYELPSGGRRGTRIGQAHRWFAFTVVDDAVEPTPDGVEFRAWRWMPIGTLIAEVAAFRRAGYRRALGSLAEWTV